MFNLCPQTIKEILIIIFTAIISGASSYFVGGWIGKNNLRDQYFLIAVKEFRDAFTDMLIFLDESRDKVSLIEKVLGYSQDSALEFIQQNVAVQEKAFVKFSSYLKKPKLDDVKKTWQDYANPNYKDGETNLSDSFRRIIAYRSKNSLEEQKVRQTIRDKINALLSFAPIK
jgi:hypothetical protein